MENIGFKPDDLEEIGERAENKFIKEGGGGGRRGKKKPVLSQNARQRIASELIENSKRNAEAEAEKVQEKWDIDTVLSRQLKRDKDNADMVHLKSYMRWLLRSISEGLSIGEGDMEQIDSRSGGPGGQNVNKVSTAIEFRHKISFISGESSDGREQSENKEKARAQVEERLNDHIQMWKDKMSSFKDKKTATGVKMTDGAAIVAILEEKVGMRLKKFQRDGFAKIVEELKR